MFFLPSLDVVVEVIQILFLLVYNPFSLHDLGKLGILQ